MMTAREAALLALERCRRDGAWSGAAIDSILKKETLSARDAALASQLCLGVLQNSRLLDFYLDYYCSKKLEPKLRDILRLGAYQLLLLDKVPDHAAVSECVELSKQQNLSRASGLVNAVLRKLSANRNDLPTIPGEGSAAYLSVRTSHPQWLCERLIEQRGYAFAEAFLSANNEPPSLDVQVNRLKISTADYEALLAQQGIMYHADPQCDGCLSLHGGRVTSLPGYEDGLFYVQDRAARCAVEIAGAVPGNTILDLCAAPGGKSFSAAVAMQNLGCITACDIHEKKLARIQEGAKRLGITCIDCQSNDARIYRETWDSAFDLVIADVPCSGLGVIRKKPEIRDKQAEEIAALPQIQRAIINTASRYVKPGGTLLYSTCTVLKEENEAVVERFLADHPVFALTAFSVGEMSSDSGMYTFWPHIDGTDGFFAAKLKRKDT